MPFLFFFFNDTATTEIYTLSLHDALPISSVPMRRVASMTSVPCGTCTSRSLIFSLRSEEHTSELQSRLHLVCRLLLEKKKTESHDLRARTTRRSDCPTPYTCR